METDKPTARCRSGAPRIRIRPAHRINDAASRVGEPARHQQRHTCRAQRSTHRARIWQHCPAEPYVDACLRRREMLQAGTSLSHDLSGL